MVIKSEYFIDSLIQDQLSSPNMLHNMSYSVIKLLANKFTIITNYLTTKAYSLAVTLLKYSLW